jgi:4-amino-4-deoxy-L-arabinose transferase-like glycosyltransferase
MSGAQQAVTEPAPPLRHTRWSRAARAAGPEAGPRSRDRDALFVVSCVLVGLWAVFQNFFRIGSAPILADEPTYVQNGWLYVHGQAHPPTVSGSSLVSVAGNFEHPPLTKYLFGLAQLLDGHAASLTASRCVSALATVLAGAVVAVWIGRNAGRWTGLLAGGLLTLLPEAASGSLGRFDRFAMLDPAASLFMVLSVVAAWEWARRTGRAAWICAALTGVAVGFAASAKENGFLGAVGPVLLAITLALATRRRTEILVRLGQAVLAIAVSGLTFAALYLPLGNPVRAIKYLIDFQSAQSSSGHLIGFAGRVTSLPPWWANLWFAGHGFGALLTVFLVIAAVCAVALRRDLLVGWCAAALAVPFVFHCFIANVALGYYWVLWTPMFLALAALGAAEVIRLAARVPAASALRVPVAVVAGVAVLAVPVGESVAQSRTVADIRPTGVQVLPQLLKQHHLNGAIISTGFGSWDFTYYLPKAKVVTSAAAPLPATAAIVISTVQCRDPLDPAVRALAAVNVADGHATRIYSDAAMTVYAVTGPLTAPTPAQVTAQPASNATDGC